MNTNGLSDSDILGRIYIAAPCSVDWDTMDGDQRVRHCQQCRLNVYNTAKMSAKETVTLIRETEGRTCLRLFRRADGTLITENCPVGLRYLRDCFKLAVASILSLIVIIGWMDSAQAQGLMGAPIDPRYGVSGMPDHYTNSPLAPTPLINHPLIISYLMTTFFFLWGYLFRQKATLFLTSAFVMVTAAACGFAIKWFELV